MQSIAQSALPHRHGTQTLPGDLQTLAAPEMTAFQGLFLADLYAPMYYFSAFCLWKRSTRSDGLQPALVCTARNILNKRSLTASRIVLYVRHESYNNM
jgi:hypothetical protein